MSDSKTNGPSRAVLWARAKLQLEAHAAEQARLYLISGRRVENEGQLILDSFLGCWTHDAAMASQEAATIYTAAFRAALEKKPS